MAVVGRKIVPKPLEEIPGICTCLCKIDIYRHDSENLSFSLFCLAVEYMREEVFACHGVIEEYLAYDHM